MWVWSDEESSMVQKEITFVPGLYKIFDEILGMIVIVTKGSSIDVIHLLFLFSMKLTQLTTNKEIQRE